MILGAPQLNLIHILDIVGQRLDLLAVFSVAFLFVILTFHLFESASQLIGIFPMIFFR